MIPQHSNPVEASHHPHQKRYDEPRKLPTREALMVVCVLLLLASAYLFYENDSLKGELADAQGKLKEATGQNAQLETSVATLRDSAAAKDGIILNLTSNLDNRAQELAAAMALLNKSEEDLANATATSAQEMRQLGGAVQKSQPEHRGRPGDAEPVDPVVQEQFADAVFPGSLLRFRDRPVPKRERV